MMERLVELTGIDAETIQKEISGKKPDEILTQYGLDETAFKTAMDSNLKELVTQLSESGFITSDQAAQITASIDTPPGALTHQEPQARSTETGTTDLGASN